jgi:hypothetical protein
MCKMTVYCYKKVFTLACTNCFLVYSSMNLHTYTPALSGYASFITSQISSCCPFSYVFLHTCLATTDLLISSMVLSFWECQINGVIWYVTLWGCLSLGVVSLRFIHIVISINSLLLFITWLLSSSWCYNKYLGLDNLYTTEVYFLPLRLWVQDQDAYRSGILWGLSPHRGSLLAVSSYGRRDKQATLRPLL